MHTKKAAVWMALLALVAVVVAPPEAFGSGRALLVVASTAAFLISAIEGSVSTRYLLAGVLGGAVLLGHSLLISLDPYRSIEFLTLAWAYYCLFGSFRYSPRDLRGPAALTLVVLAGAVSLYGIHQFFWGLDQAYAYVLYSGASEALRLPVASRVASGRIFSTFALPGTLWGFLILTLPLHAMLWKRARPVPNAALVVNAGLVLSAAAMTRSYGFVLGLFVVLLGWLSTRSKASPLEGVVWKRAGLLLTGLLSLVPVLYVVRGVHYNPVSLRLQSWLSAWEMFAAHPWGVGLNSYGVLYLQHQQPGANETQFAHNTPVQLLAELGIVGLLAVLALVWIGGRRPRLEVLDRLKKDGPHRYLMLAILVWSVHNLMDINMYFGSIGAVGFALIALLARSPGQPVRHRISPLRKRLVQATGVAALAVTAVAGVIYVSGELLYRARTELGMQNVREAAGTLALAGRINPYDSAIYHEAGQVALELYHAENDRAWLDLARSYFSRAAELSPFKVGPHIGLALCASTLDRTEEALRRLEMAQTLHPANTQVSAIRRLVEQRHGALVESGE